MGSFNMIVPELPDYLTQLGGEDYKGLIISLFATMALLSRPFSGKLTDTVGRIPVMIIGTLVCVVCGFLYPMVGTVWGFLLLRFVHGFSTGFKPTGTTTYLADIVVPHRRGEAMGVLGMAGSAGMAMGPPIGSAIANAYSLDVMFYCSSAVALLSALVVIGMKESLENRVKFKASLFKPSVNDVYEPRVMHPSIVMALTTFSFGIVVTVLPDLSKHLGFENKGIVFTAFLLTSVLTRFVAGKASDKYGRAAAMKVGTAVLTVSMLLIGFSDSTTFLLVAAGIYGISTGINSPTLFAWTADLSDEAHRGRGMSTMFIALELGIILGSFISGMVYDNDASMFPITFSMGAIFSAAALVYLLLSHRKN